MKVFKTLEGFGTAESIELTRENYTDKTNLQEPYHQIDDEGDHYYAVCPKCENPTRIIGLYKVEEDSSKESSLYARHAGKKIIGIADYDYDEYRECPYSDPKYRKNGAARKPTSRTAIGLYELMRENFDRVCYIWNKTMPIRLSTAYAQMRLRAWADGKGWLTYEISYQNLPWMFMYIGGAHNLQNRWIKKDSELYKTLRKKRALEEHSVENFDDYARFTTKSGNSKFTYYLCKHVARCKDKTSKIDEHMWLRVVLDDRIIYREKITIPQDYFMNQMMLNMLPWPFLRHSPVLPG